MSSDVERLPKQDLLLKLLRMTTSDNDGEALVALRKVTKLMSEAGWTWDKLITSRITVMADPFASLGDPGFTRAPPTEARQPSFHSPMPPRPSPSPPQAAPTVKTTHPIGIASNRFESGCYCCGKTVAKGGGYFFRPSDHHARATNSFMTICTTCHNDRSTVIGPSAAPRTGPRSRKASADDLA